MAIYYLILTFHVTTATKFARSRTSLLRFFASSLPLPFCNRLVTTHPPCYSSLILYNRHHSLRFSTPCLVFLPLAADSPLTHISPLKRLASDASVLSVVYRLSPLRSTRFPTVHTGRNLGIGRFFRLLVHRWMDWAWDSSSAIPL